jgi:hypothetical protein
VFERLWEGTGCRAVITALAGQRKQGFALERAVFLTVLHRLFVSGDIAQLAFLIGGRLVLCADPKVESGAAPVRHPPDSRCLFIAPEKPASETAMFSTVAERDSVSGFLYGLPDPPRRQGELLGVVSSRSSRPITSLQCWCDGYAGKVYGFMAI